MKTRLGFVSNSSSSSFIIRKGRHNNVFSLADAMLDIRNDEWREYNSEDNDLGEEQAKLKQARSLNVNQDTPVWFSTTNYDTFIRKNDYGDFEVDTCNNQEWGLLEEVCQTWESFNEETGESKKDKTFYWHIKSGVFGKPISSSENPDWKKFRQTKDIDTWPSCPVTSDHMTGMAVLPTGEIVCIDCYMQANKSDMIINPIKTIRSIPSVILKPTIKMRGPV